MKIYDSGAGDFETPEEGPVVAVVSGYIDMGLSDPGQYGSKPTIALQFELADHMSNGERFTMWEWFPVSLHKRSKLRPCVEALLGPLTPEKGATGLDTRELMGKSCVIDIMINDNGRAKAKSYQRLMRGQAGIVAERGELYCEGPSGPDYEMLGDGMKTLVIEGHARKREAEEKKRKAEEAADAAARLAEARKPDLDDSIPF